MMHPKPFTIVSKAIRSLPGRETITCTLGWRCRGAVCLCHLRGKWALGLAKKPDDTFGVYACDGCHAILDGRETKPHWMLCRPSHYVIFGLYLSQHLMHQHQLIEVRP